MIFLLISSVNAHAGTSAVDTTDPENKYCKDSSKRVFYVSASVDSVLNSTMSRNLVDSAELVTNLEDGTAVIIPCFNNRIEAMKGRFIESLIVDQNNIFVAIQNPKKENIRAIGINYKNSMVLVEENIAKILKYYFIRKTKSFPGK